jgi:hypothetical protein
MANADPGKRGGARLLIQGAFLMWLVVVNVLYYLQFKQLFLARFASLVHK